MAFERRMCRVLCACGSQLVSVLACFLVKGVYTYTNFTPITCKDVHTHTISLARLHDVMQLSCVPFGRLHAPSAMRVLSAQEAAGPCLMELESGCIQGLMDSAIHASTQPLAAALRTVRGNEVGMDRALET